jgi:hypothetical protein
MSKVQFLPLSTIEQGPFIGIFPRAMEQGNDVVPFSVYHQGDFLGFTGVPKSGKCVKNCISTGEKLDGKLKNFLKDSSDVKTEPNVVLNPGKLNGPLASMSEKKYEQAIGPRGYCHTCSHSDNPSMCPLLAGSKATILGQQPVLPGF